MNALQTLMATGTAALLLAASASAQGIGDTAAREKARRQSAKEQAKKPEPAKVFTNDDLAEGRPPGQKTDESAPSSSSGLDENQPQGAAAPAQPIPGVESPAGQEKPLLDAVSAAQARVTTAQTKVQQLADKLNPMSVSYIYGAGGSNDANEELRVRAEMRDAENELQQARQDLAQANRALQNSRQGRPSLVEQ